MLVSQLHNEFKVGVDKIDSLNSANLLPEEIDIFLNNAQRTFIEQRAYGTNPKREGLEETQKRLDDLRNIVSNTTISTFTTNSNNKPNGYFIALPTNYMHAIQEEADIRYNDCNSTKVTSSNIVSGSIYFVQSGSIVYNSTTYTAPAYFTGVTVAANAVTTFTGTGIVYNSVTKRIPVKPITHDRYNKVIHDPFNKPYQDEVIRLGYERVSNNESFELITDGSFSISNYYLRYLREPNEIQYGTTYAVPTTDVDCELSDYTHREIIAIAVQEALANIEANNRYQTKAREVTTIE